VLTQRTELAEQLPQNGWRVLGVEDSDLQWWADEIWVIESSWSPRGFRLFLTFLVDPAADAQRAKGEDVWAVGASTEHPHDRGSAEGKPLLSLGHNWQAHLAEFFAGLSELRDSKGRVS
jgi:hypothetical protein